MKFTTAVLDISAGETGDKTIPDQYPAISDLLGYIAITYLADTGSGVVTVSLVTTGLDITLKDKRTITITTNDLSNNGILILTYSPAIDIA